MLTVQLGIWSNLCLCLLNHSALCDDFVDFEMLCHAYQFTLIIGCLHSGYFIVHLNSPCDQPAILGFDWVTVEKDYQAKRLAAFDVSYFVMCWYWIYSFRIVLFIRHLRQFGSIPGFSLSTLLPQAPGYLQPLILKSQRWLISKFSSLMYVSDAFFVSLAAAELRC